MDWIAIGTIIGSTVTALGGFEFVKWWFNRGTYARKEEIEVKTEEQNLHAKEIDRYAKEIERYAERQADRDTKVDSLYRELRDAQMRILVLTEEVNRLKLENQLLQFQKCEERGCPQRKPPGDY